MKNLYIFLFFATYYGFSQGIQDKTIFNIIISDNINTATTYIGCSKSKTYFDSENFIKQTDLQVPDKILRQLEESSKKDQKSQVWDTITIAELDSLFKEYKVKFCLGDDEIEAFYNRNKKRKPIFFVSEPIFDYCFEHCIVSFSSQIFKGSASGHSYFLKNVYGSWTIIASFDFWIT